MSDLTQARLRQVLTYDPLTGEFRWVKIRRGIRPGTVAGRMHSDGYVEIQIDHKMYYAHRLAWFWMNGRWPDGQIDHINHERSDNRLVNLRQATHTQNTMNARTHQRACGLPRGVVRNGGCYGMRIRSHGRSYAVNGFAQPEDAHDFYMLAAEMLHGEFAYHLSDDKQENSP